MTALRGAGTQMGRGSAGPRARTIPPREEVVARRDRLRKLPPSAERSRGLAECRSQLRTIANRVSS